MFNLIFILKYSAAMYSNLTFILSYLISFLEAAKEKDWSRKTTEKNQRSPKTTNKTT